MRLWLDHAEEGTLESELSELVTESERRIHTAWLTLFSSFEHVHQYWDPAETQKTCLEDRHKYALLICCWLLVGVRWRVVDRTHMGG